MKALLWITYCGKDFCGFQVQPNRRTVQSVLQDAIQALFGVRYDVVGCSRTDSGVHAERFACLIQAPLEALSLSRERIPTALNAYLPQDLSVISAVAVADDFHPRYCQHEKEYEYRIWNANYENPLQSGFCAFVPQPLCIEAMQQAAQDFVGTQDFSSFCAAGAKVTDPVRTVSACTVSKEGEQIIIRVRADGFLYHMVRILAGTLIGIGTGRYAPTAIKEMLKQKNRAAAGATAAAQGLFLHRVYYPNVDCP